MGEEAAPHVERDRVVVGGPETISDSDDPFQESAHNEDVGTSSKVMVARPVAPFRKPASNRATNPSPSSGRSSRLGELVDWSSHDNVYFCILI